MFRIMGLPGEEVRIKDKVVFVNGKRLDDRRRQHLDKATHPHDYGLTNSLGLNNIPDGAVMVLAENRDYSFDSCSWGLVEIKEIEGKALFIDWSEDLSRIGNQLN